MQMLTEIGAEQNAMTAVMMPSAFIRPHARWRVAGRARRTVRLVSL